MSLGRAGELDAVRILVVEDDFFVAEGLRSTLDTLGCDVIGPAPDTAEARRLIDASPPDLALLDLSLHGETTEALARELIAAEVPIVFVTGFGSAEGMPHDLRAVPRLCKPVQERALQKLMLTLLGVSTEPWAGAGQDRATLRIRRSA